MINKQQQRIYNSWLAITRSSAGKPFQLRKDFTKFDEITASNLYKLEKLFTKHKSIDMQDFFVAPFKVYGDTNNVPLKWYTTMKAINVYKIYKKQVENNKT